MAEYMCPRDGETFSERPVDGRCPTHKIAVQELPDEAVAPPSSYTAGPTDMNTLRTLTQEQLEVLLKEGELPESVRLSAPKVVVVMTQDWCGQWTNMAAYLPDFASQAAIFTVEYNLLPDFERIMRFKETVLGNAQVPYVRFYRDGKLVRQSNWLPRASFAAILDRD
jgi:hypothetical protein